jgi:hypothetical protein
MNILKMPIFKHYLMKLVVYTFFFSICLNLTLTLTLILEKYLFN